MEISKYFDIWKHYIDFYSKTRSVGEEICENTSRPRKSDIGEPTQLNLLVVGSCAAANWKNQFQLNFLKKAKMCTFGVY